SDVPVPAQPGDDTVTLNVSRGTDGVTRVSLVETDFAHGTSTLLQSFNLVAGSDDQIRLHLTNSAAQNGVVHASYDLLHNGLLDSTVTFAATGHIFDNETWVRGQIYASGPAVVGVSPSADSIVVGTYGNLNIHPDGTWSYGLDNVAAQPL